MPFYYLKSGLRQFIFAERSTWLVQFEISMACKVIIVELIHVAGSTGLADLISENDELMILSN